MKAAVAGATVMVLTRCLNMEQAYRAIDWRSIFLIAGMLPLAIAIAATRLASQVAHPANVMVMGPGGYRFADYLKIGLPLTLVVLVVALLLLPWVWPL